MMGLLKSWQVVAAVMVGMVVVAGCAEVPGGSRAVTESASTPTSVEPQGTSMVDATVLSGGPVHGNYLEFDSPEDLATRMPVALVGRIDGFKDGQTFTVDDERDYSVVARVRVDKVYKADGVTFPDGFAYVSIPRGVAVVDDSGQPIEGAGEPFTVTPVAAYTVALPKGTKVVVISAPHNLGDGPGTVGGGQGHPDNATLLASGSGQTFSVEVKPGVPLSGWPDLTLADVVDRLETVRTG